MRLRAATLAVGSILSALVFCAPAAFPGAALSAGPEIFLREEPESYLIIDKLEGLGRLPDLMTDDRALEAREVAREAKKAAEDDDPLVAGMARFLSLGEDRNWDFRLRTALSHSRRGAVPPNGQGLPIPEDGGIGAGGFFRASPVEWMALQARGDLLAGSGGAREGRIEETSVRLGGPAATLEAGRFSLWWGPGRHGGLLFGTNAEPLWGVRFRNPRPIPLGWWFRFLGLFQYDLFVSRLEEDRPIPHTILTGLRLAVKPASWLELGASRAMHFGGEGRSVTLATIKDVFTSSNENTAEGPGNQLAGVDAKVRFSAAGQPVVLYVEGGAEDHSRWWSPSKWAWLAGVFLPSLGGSARADFRVEFADTFDSANGQAIWYRHGASGEGYAHRYRGRILGHHLGTDARDLFVEVHYFLLPSSYVELNADLTHRYFPGPAPEDSRRFGAAVVAWLTRNLRAEGRLAFERISNLEGTPGQSFRDTAVQAALAYQYR